MGKARARSVGQDITLQGNRLTKPEKFQVDDTDAEVSAHACVPLFVFRQRLSQGLVRDRREAVFFSSMIAMRRMSRPFLIPRERAVKQGAR